jgi:hypothetical protein
MADKDKKVTGYKAFNKDWQCNGMQYKLGENHKHDGKIKLCSTGLHFCENPLDMLSYYPVVGSKFAEVEAEGVSDETSNDSKRVAKSLTIKSELTLEGLTKASVKFLFSKIDWKNAKGDTSATSGNGANSATSGNGANSATSGNGAHSATSGNDANSATSGEYANSATSGNRANSATSGNGAHSATSGNDANSATSGEYANSATSGNRANSATSGYGANSATSGNDAIACAIGRKAAAKGSIGCWIVVAEWQEGEKFEDAKPINVKAVQVDGKKIKADTFYELKDGKFVEA